MMARRGLYNNNNNNLRVISIQKLTYDTLTIGEYWNCYWGGYYRYCHVKVRGQVIVGFVYQNI